MAEFGTQPRRTIMNLRRLPLYEEILLLALDDDTITTTAAS